MNWCSYSCLDAHNCALNKAAERILYISKMISLTKIYNLISKFLCEKYDNRTSGQDGTVSTDFRD